MKAFKEEHVIYRANVRKKVEDIMKDYDNKCYKAQSKNRRKGQVQVQPLRKLNSIWRRSPVPVNKHINKKYVNPKTNNDLFNIGKNMELLTGNEKKFYEDQCNARIYRLSEEIDEKDAEETHIAQEDLEQERSFHEEEESFLNPLEFQEVISSNSKDRRSSGKVTLCDNCNGKSSTANHVTKPVRKSNNSDPRAKDVIATKSVRQD